ncbi:uncharacterized protein LOC110433006 isoform X3 [Sorghum bicolor]|uniref:uncharacterized protein LOC110433006 isoform X3 n=1 Tax=Sorghum bicolor TaxID=4558 RepID=UPI000B426652|nr:uncharacterized protein LOC110433006 isoform X3 [Sorghum bicolor]|eukprot:XP_021310157.1 uncharacterized protein LOC110433006 isoform X3 [Sorghum bicolor]
MYQTNQGGGGQNTFSHSMSTNLLDISYIEQNSMYMTTSRVDDYPTSMSSHGTSRITNYDAEMLTGSAAGSSNTYRYKKGGFTELMLEQIRNSHEDDQSDSNRQQLERMQGTLTQMIIGNDMNENMSLENLDGIFGPQTDWSISESRTSYEVDIKIKQWLITFISNTKCNHSWCSQILPLCSLNLMRWYFA